MYTENDDVRNNNVPKGNSGTGAYSSDSATRV